jgi:hypothetical protein
LGLVGIKGTKLVVLSGKSRHHNALNQDFSDLGLIGIKGTKLVLLSGNLGITKACKWPSEGLLESFNRLFKGPLQCL